MSGLMNVDGRDLHDPSVDDVLCEQFATYFSDKVSKIRAEIDAPPPAGTACEQGDCSGNIDLPLDVLTPTTVSEVEGIIKACKNKSCLLDQLLTQHLTKTLAGHSLWITALVNQSFQEAIFPGMFKEIIVRPILKKSTPDKNAFVC